MNPFLESEDPTIDEAGRILIEAHRDWVSPKIHALNETVADICGSFEELSRGDAPKLQLFVVPSGRSECLPFDSFTDKTAELKSQEAIKACFHSWRAENPFSGYASPINSESSGFSLLLRIGGWENNQAFQGLVLLTWHGIQQSPLPFPLPAKFKDLPESQGHRILPLTPGFERTTKHEATWIAFPAQIKHSPAWDELESAIAVLSQTGAQIMQRLVPVLNDAAWKSMARRVMHELSRTVAMPQPLLKESSKALSSALGAVRRANFHEESGIEAKLTGHLDTIQQNLNALKHDQNYVESKVRWFFYLVAEELRSEAKEEASIRDILRQAIESLGGNLGADCYLEAPTDPKWSAKLDLPKQFPQHCMEALVSNSYLRRDTSAPVTLAWRKADDAVFLQWTNLATIDDINRLEEELAKPPTARSFGLRMTDAISATFFQTPLEILIERRNEHTYVHHRLAIPQSMIL